MSDNLYSHTYKHLVIVYEWFFFNFYIDVLDERLFLLN